MTRKAALIISYLFHPVVVLPLFLLVFMDWSNMSNNMITFWFATAFLTSVVPYFIARKLAAKQGKPVHEFSSAENKRQILMPSFMFFSLAFLYFVIEVSHYEGLFRVPLILVLGFYLGLYLTLAFVLIVYAFKINLSLHVIVWGNVFGFFYFWIFIPGYLDLLPYLFVTLAIVLAVGVARYWLGAHKRWELYLSFVAGVLFSLEVVYVLKWLV